MNLLILSQKRNLYSTRRLIETAQKQGHTVNVLDPLNLLLILGKKSHSVFYKNLSQQIAKIDAVLPRIGSSMMDYGLAVVIQFNMMGIPTINNFLPIALSRDKFRCLQLLSCYDIDIPKTAMIRTLDQIDEAIKMVGGFPIVLKLLRGTQGIGVMLAKTRDSALNTLWGLQQDVMIQEFISESKGKDIRALVVNGKVVAAMRREARIGEFRSNIHRGGIGQLIDLKDEFKHVALKSVEVIGLDIAGVDMLESNTGPKIIEINSSPGFEGLEKATGKDIAKCIIDYAENFSKKDKKVSNSCFPF